MVILAFPLYFLEAREIQHSQQRRLSQDHPMAQSLRQAPPEPDPVPSAPVSSGGPVSKNAKRLQFIRLSRIQSQNDPTEHPVKSNLTGGASSLINYKHFCMFHPTPSWSSVVL